MRAKHHVSRVLRFGYSQARADAGNAAVEFALIAPIFVLILAATFEIGTVIHARFDLNARISSAANYSLLIGGAIDDGSAQDHAMTLASLLADGSGESRATVNFNHSVEARADREAVSTTRTGRRADECYCPALSGGEIAWGSATPCQSPCADGSRAGRFVELAASTSYTALFGGFGLVDGDAITVGALVRLP